MKELAYLWGKPQQTGRLKAEFTDFIVKEELGYPLSGEGEFVAIHIRKTDANTLYVGEKLAAFTGISAKNMSYAGLKDRHAITEQWFCLHLPGKETPDFSTFQLDGVDILRITRHCRKIRIGSLSGNHFEILLRNITQTEDLMTRLNQIQTVGFPNYFTEQRFGRDKHNLTQAQRWANHEISIKDRKKRSFYLSALRSDVFNTVVSERIQKEAITKIVENDILQLSGSHSWFIAHSDELEALYQRLLERDILLTAPLIGEDSAETNCNEDERNIIDNHTHFLALLKKERVKSTRRPMLVIPQQFHWQFEDHGLRLSFFLESGSYATALVRELINIEDNIESKKQAVNFK